MRSLAILGLLLLLPSSRVLAAEYPYTDAWSSPAQREEWFAQLKGLSKSDPVVQFHLIGQLHGLAATIPLAEPSADGVLSVLELIRPMLGLKSQETLRAIRTDKTFALVAKGSDFREAERIEIGFVVDYKEFAETGREIVVQVDPRERLVVGLFNGHIPAMDGYMAASSVVSLEDALASVNHAEGDACELVRDQLGWVALDWWSGSIPGKKMLVWTLKVQTPDGGLRDYMVEAATGSVVFQGQNRFQFAHQRHVSYVLNGGTYFSTLPAGPVCNALSQTCNDPAFTDSLASRAAMPALTSQYEFLTSGSSGLSGWWRAPVAWGAFPRLNPWQNNHRDPATDMFQLVVSATSSTTQSCAPFAPPCGNNGTWFIYGVGDVDPSVYSHEYAHPLLGYTKVLRSQTGADGQTTEGMCDVFGVAVENEVLATQDPCGSVCAGANRTDFILTAPSVGITQDLNLPMLTCGNPREWIGRAFRQAVQDQALHLSGGIPVPPGGATRAQDFSIEITLRGVIEAFSVAPAVMPTQMDLYAATLSLTNLGLFASGTSVVYFYNALHATNPVCP